MKNHIPQSKIIYHAPLTIHKILWVCPILPTFTTHRRHAKAQNRARGVLGTRGRNMDFTRNGLLTVGNQHLTGITDLEIGFGGVLYTGSQVSNGMTAWQIGTGMATQIDQIGYTASRGTYVLSEISLMTVDGQDIILPSGRYDDRLAIHRIDGDGEFDGVKALGLSSNIIGHMTHTEAMTVDGKTYMITTQQNQDGFSTFRLRDDLSLEYKRHFDDTNSAYAGAISDIASTTVNGRSFFFTASASEDGVTAWWIGRYGNVKRRRSVGTEEDLAIDTPTTIEAVDVDGTTFLIVGSAGTGSLSILKVNEWGGLFARDHLLDDLGTRFDGVVALETVTVNDRVFIFIGGADDGISMLELSGDGQLHHVVTIADQLNTTLDNVSGIAAHVVGDSIKVFVSSAVEEGITQFSVSTADLGVLRSGTKVGETLTGTSDDDLIMGYDGADTLIGGKGEDRLVDGAGVDELFGGKGDDTFVFIKDARMDRAMDFDDGHDQIDLTAFSTLHSVSQLTFVQKSYGVLVSWGNERLAIEPDSGTLEIADLTNVDFVFA